MTRERWRAVPDWPDYDVSDHGRVRSRKVGRGTVAAAGGALIMAPTVNKRGRHQVRLSDDGRRRMLTVGRLVLLAFAGPCPPGKECCHADDDPGNNHLENLRWDTHESNMRDQVRNGLHSFASRKACRRGGHLLKAPNLVTSSPGRACLACHRARTWAGDLRRRRGITVPRDQVTAYAHERYREIMTSSAAA